MKKKILLCGRTGTGKSTIAKEMSRYGYSQVVSYTTRPKRDSETESADHYFISPEEVNAYRDNIVAYTKIGEYEYFATKEELDKKDIYVIDPSGIENIKKIVGDEYDFVEVYLRTPKKELCERYTQRKQTKKEFEKRYMAENKQFLEYERARNFQYHILNSGITIDKCVEKLKRLMENEGF